MVEIEEIGFKIIAPNAQLIDIEKLIEKRRTELESNSNQLNCFPDCMYIIEHVGRICYNSYKEGQVFDDFRSFIHGAATRGHRSMFEFGALQFTMPVSSDSKEHYTNLLFHLTTKYIDVNFDTQLMYGNTLLTITGSPRGLIELLERMIEEGIYDQRLYVNLYVQLIQLLPDIVLKWETYQSLAQTFDIMRPITLENDSKLTDISKIYQSPYKGTKFLVLVQCSRSESHEIVRHRPASFLQASQRYIRYNNKNPYIVCLGKKQQESENVRLIIEQAKSAFDSYTLLLTNKEKPENARVVLPNCTETKVFIYADKQEWQHFFRMRQSKFAYPPVKEIFDSIYQQLIDKKLI